MAYEITGDAQEAEECENDAYLKAWNSIPPHEPHEYLFPFLTRLLRNSALNCCRSKSSGKRKALLQELNDELSNTIPSREGVEESVSEHQLAEAINTFLSALPEETRRVFIRRYWYMDSIERIAKGYGISNAKVKSMLFRCRNKLRDYLEKEGYHI